MGDCLSIEEDYHHQHRGAQRRPAKRRPQYTSNSEPVYSPQNECVNDHHDTGGHDHGGGCDDGD